jgi:hypothetical protein
MHEDDHNENSTVGTDAESLISLNCICQEHIEDSRS